MYKRQSDDGPIDDGPSANNDDGEPGPLVETSATCKRIEDFGIDAAERWRVVNDGVMGGLSFGSLSIDGGVLRFEGEINTDGGGFSLIETSTLRNGGSLRDALTEAEFLRVRVRAEDGRAYELIAEDDVARSSRQIMHFAPIPISTTPGWEELDVSITDLSPRIFGRTVTAEPAFEAGQARSIGIILADGVDGAFVLEIDRIDACTA